MPYLSPNTKVRTMARWAAAGCGLAAALAALLCAYAVLAIPFPRLGLDLAKAFQIDDLVGPFTLWQRVVAALIWCLHPVLALLVFATGARLFAAMAEGHVFDQRAAARLIRMGWLMVLIVPVNQVAELMGTGILSYWAGIVGEGRMSMSFTSMDLFALVTAFILLCFGQILAQANELAQENQSFV